jgi:prevent-host-death family protein
MVASKHPAPSLPHGIAGSQEVSATVAKNEFGRVLDMALRGGRVVITKHNAPTAVLLSADAYEGLTGRATPDLEALREEFEVLLERMQTPGAQAGTAALFAASPTELGAAAVKASRARRRTARRA